LLARRVALTSIGLATFSNSVWLAPLVGRVVNLRATRHDEPVSLAGRLADTGDKTIMLYAIVLICGLSTPHLNCDETTAHRYERVPGGNELPFMCQRSAEIWAAEHVEIKAGEYPKIRCSRHEFGSRVG
jgi:hypothetical protein